MVSLGRYNRTYQKKIRGAVSTLKINLGCAKCGYNKCARALQFHHQNGDKKSTIARLVDQGRSMLLIQVEMEKCILLCANCHHEEHDRLDTSKGLLRAG